MPDGKPFVLVHSSLPDSWSREADTLWLKSMEAIGIRMRVNTAPFADLLKQSLAGQLPMFNLGYRALDPSGYQILATLWGRSPPDTNRSRFRLPEYDAAYEAFLRTAAGTGAQRARAAACRSSCRPTRRCRCRCSASATRSCIRGCAATGPRRSASRGSTSTSIPRSGPASLK